MAKVPLAGTEWVPGATEEKALAEIKRLLEKYVEYPIDYLPAEAERLTPAD
jgi:predicted RNase H-like HicB family nuclease